MELSTETLVSYLSLKIQDSPGLASWLKGLGISIAFTTYSANRLHVISTAVPADGLLDPYRPSETPQLKLHERLFVAGESRWMARCQIGRLGNLLAARQLHEDGDASYVPVTNYTTIDVNAHEVVLGQGGQMIAPYPKLTFPAHAAIDRCNTSMVRPFKRHLGAHLRSNGRSRLTQELPLQPPPPQSSSPPDP